MTEERLIFQRIQDFIRANPDSNEMLEDCFQSIRNLAEVEGAKATRYETEWLRNRIVRRMKAETTGTEMKRLNELLRATYLHLAQDDLHSYLIFLEWDRKPHERFYQPRMRIMRRFVEQIQKLIDGELEELFLSCPPRIGKTTLLMFLETFLIGRDSERSNLYCAYSDTITKAFYDGVLEVLTDPITYNWAEVFPDSRIVSTNSKDETINLDRKKRYPSLTCRSLYGTLNGACDCDGFLISDDLIGGIEEALNKDRLMAAWSKVDNNMLPRAKEKARILWCGTRWSIADPAGMRMDLLLNDEKFRDRKYDIINIPALNATGESNFNYDYGVGFSTKFYEQRMASFEHNNDMASWLAQYQGEPIERSGCLFEPQDMKYYNGTLPEAQPVRIFMAIDPAFGGGDFTSAPVCFQYEDGSVFVHDVVYSNADKRITQPLIVDAIAQYGIQAVQIECTKATMPYKEKIEELLMDKGIKINIMSKAAPNNVAKETRIFDKAPDIRDFYYRESGKRTKEYNQFMQNIFAFKMNGKNRQHDDSVDSLAMCVDMLLGKRFGVAEVQKRTKF